MIEHWDGSSWTQISPPPLPAEELAFAFDALVVDARGAWLPSSSRYVETIIWRHDGAEWHRHAADISVGLPALSIDPVGRFWTFNKSGAPVTGNVAILDFE
jgi:hypothetical protein